MQSWQSEGAFACIAQSDIVTNRGRVFRYPRSRITLISMIFFLIPGQIGFERL